MNSLENLPRYHYSPLERASFLRILVLQPSNHPEAQLEADLIHANRDDVISGNNTIEGYEAISYCWGDAIFSHSLVCGGTSKIPITANVDAMLRRFRKSNKYRYLWIDAICLNQQDLEEKDIQVPRMGEIYQRATKVNVWLGQATDDDAIPRVFSVLKAQFIEAKFPKKTPRGSKKIENLQLLDPKSINTLNRLLSRPWFERRWILQEVAFGQHITVYCGASKLNWNWFFGGISALARSQSQVDGSGLLPSLSKVSRTMAAICASPGQSFLVDLLWNFRTSQCSMPEDKIFAILGIAEDARRFSRAGARLHWSEVYTLVATVLFPTHSNAMFRHLMCFGSLSQLFPACPSWVPNWNARGSEFLFDRMGACERKVDSHASQRRTTQINGKGLSFQTKYAADVEILGQKTQSLLARVGEALSNSASDREYAIWALAPVFVNFMRAYPQFPDPLPPDLEEYWHTKSVRDALRHILEQDLRAPTTSQQDVIRIIEFVAHNSTLFILRNRRMPSEFSFGIGPANMQSEDVMLTLPDDETNHSSLHPKKASLGLVVRPRHKFEFFHAQCQFVGPCFYHIGYGHEDILGMDTTVQLM